MYLVKFIHVSTVILSYALFFVRGVWMIQDSDLRRRRLVKVAPHVVDTVLLASGLTLAFMIHQYPFVDAWLTAKLTGLLVYIGLGLVALRFGRARSVRIGAWIAAQVVFFYIVAAAVSHSPAPFATTL